MASPPAPILASAPSSWHRAPAAIAMVTPPSVTPTTTASVRDSRQLPPAPVSGAGGGGAIGERPAGAIRRFGPWGALFTGYLALSVALWWHVWSGHPADTMTCLCGDPAQSLWFLAWVAHAMAHGQDPLLSTAAGHPGGVNLLANQSSVLVGVVLAPITWVFGPVASLNVALTLAAPVNGLAAVALCRRFTGWGPAAAGGALFGLSPLVLSELTFAHLADTVLVFVPIIVLCMHELLVRQQGPPVRWGAALALAITAQFFVSAEMLVALAVLATPLVVGILVFQRARTMSSWEPSRGNRPGASPGARTGARTDNPSDIRPGTSPDDPSDIRAGTSPGNQPDARPGARTDNPSDIRPGARSNNRPGTRPVATWSSHHALVGMVVAGLGSAALLAWPVWFALAGPRHITGSVWAGTGNFGVPWTSFFSATRASTATRLFTRYSGYLGTPGLPAAYLGPTLLTILAGGVVANRRRPAAWAALATVLLAGVLALGSALLPFAWYSSWWLPWRALAGLPVLDDVVPQRLMAVGFLGSGVLLALTLDAVTGRRRRGGVDAPASATSSSRPGPAIGSTRRRTARWWRAAAAGATAAIALAPIVVPSATFLTVGAVQVPAWFAQVAPTMPPRTVLLVLPFPSGRVSNAMGWQALDGFSFAIAGAYAKVPGPGGTVQYSGAPGSADAVLSQLTEPTGPLPLPTASAEAAVRRALLRWHVTTVVATGRQVGAVYPARYAATFLTATLGRVPAIEAGTWVWQHPATDPAPLAVDARTVQRCVALADQRGAPMLTGPRCVALRG